MENNTDLTNKPVEQQHATGSETVKFPKPKILLIDVEAAAARALQNSGWNVSEGTFGTPYRIPKNHGYVRVRGKALLPNHAEQEIIIVDLRNKELAPHYFGDQEYLVGEKYFFTSAKHGFIDPRPKNMVAVASDFQRILNNGGLFVIFAEATSTQNYIRAKVDVTGQPFEQQESEINIYSFLPELTHLLVQEDRGSEMLPDLSDPILGPLVGNHLAKGTFGCTLSLAREWPETIPLAKNKFGEPIGLVNYNERTGSVIIVLPSLTDTSTFFLKLIGEALPSLRANLFPDLERGKWVYHSAYELPRVSSIEQAKSEVLKRAEAEINTLDQELAKERQLNGWQHDLITCSGDPLVSAVERGFHMLGFQKIENVDTEQDAQGATRREDLQIRDRSPTLIVDVKGLGGLPADPDVWQAGKHAMFRIREWDRTDVTGLAIINHQRHLPPLERENAKPFRDEMLKFAEDSKLGLMTTWDMFKLIRNTQQWGWKPEHVIPLFYKAGRIQPIPCHYQFIGDVAKVWTGKFGVVLECGELNIGDTLAVEFPLAFHEFPIPSLHVDGKAVERAFANNNVGLLWDTEELELREGMKVYRVSGEHRQL